MYLWDEPSIQVKSGTAKNLIGLHKIQLNENLRSINTSQCLCCQQVISTTRNSKTQEIFNVYHKVSCKNKYVFYLLESLLCKIQFVGMLETHFISH